MAKSAPPASQVPFQGWKVVFVSALGNALAMGMGTLNFGLFIHPMGNELGISRAEFGWANSLRQYMGALTSPTLGRWLDRYGARGLLAGAMFVAGGALMLLGQVNSGWQMVALFALMGFVGIYGPGQLLTTVPVMKWFVAKRAKAVAVMSLGVPIGALIFMLLTQYLIANVGWRSTWLILGGIVLVLMVPACLLWMRRAPEDLGQHPDGQPHAVGVDEAGHETSLTRAVALRTPAFWQLTAVVSLIGFSIGTVALHRIPAFVDRGLSPEMIAVATAVDAALAGVGTFLFGMLGGKLPSRYFGALGFALMALGTVLMIFTESTVDLFVCMSIWGVGIGGMMYMQNIIWAEYFGRDHVGAIRGAAMPITLIVGGIGAPMAGYLFDWLGSYTQVWWGSASAMLLGALIILITRKPSIHPTATQQPTA